MQIKWHKKTGIQNIANFYTTILNMPAKEAKCIQFFHIKGGHFTCFEKQMKIFYFIII